MVLQLSVATEADVECIASIHLAAFDSNPLLHAQFPTPSSLKGLHTSLSQDALSTIRKGESSGKIVLVVRETAADDRIIGFAKWDLPQTSEGIFHSDITWPEGCRQEYLDEYIEKAESAKNRVIGDNPCYRLTFVATHPRFQGRGAGTLLTEWGLERARQEGNIPVYLESTIAASSLYRRLGFVALDGLSMTLPEDGSTSGPNIYEEVCMLKTWEDDYNTDIGHWDSTLSISSLLQDYEAGIKPQDVVQAIFERIEAYNQVQPSVWIYLQPIGEVMRAANELPIRWPNPKIRPALYGVPFSVKDSIDVPGVPTATGCPPLASTPATSAPVYQRCIDAGALFIGKTNMEQLATGMTGCRSPFGTLHSTFSKRHIVGGSSSGSAVTVSQGLVSFSLGSDTAGSIRVPAMFNGIYGFKPTKGTVSARGVSPACLHQDCVSFLTCNVEDAETVWEVCKGFDKGDFFAKLPRPIPVSAPRKLSFRFGIPPAVALEICSPPFKKQFAEVVEMIKRYGTLADMDWRPFAAANELLYSSSFVMERLTILPDGWFAQNKQLLHPVTRQVFESVLARNSSAVDLFKDLHKQAEYKRAVEGILTLEEDSETDEITLMVVPTTPFHPTIEEVGKDPIGINGRLGSFAHFANVLDLVGIAMPCGTYETDEVAEGQKTRLPFGVTVLAGAGLDGELLKIAKVIEESLQNIGQE
ncbi:amidase signature enzyme [Hyaloscypha variabilis F]|uniref:Amidase signature enzyme n=1 Tax=Hyaloscypha variabilis (strain UAMH 11265 / GT02V1 / F) TaxID=1149755 RepID=A0A2J6SC87_HYAVF|nr:amidase signature enzyme [Hyaloscypha variabilis F]